MSDKAVLTPQEIEDFRKENGGKLPSEYAEPEFKQQESFGAVKKHFGKPPLSAGYVMEYNFKDPVTTFRPIHQIISDVPSAIVSITAAASNKAEISLAGGKGTYGSQTVSLGSENAFLIPKGHKKGASIEVSGEFATPTSIVLPTHPGSGAYESTYDVTIKPDVKGAFIVVPPGATDNPEIRNKISIRVPVSLESKMRVLLQEKEINDGNNGFSGFKYQIGDQRLQIATIDPKDKRADHEMSVTFYDPQSKKEHVIKFKGGIPLDHSGKPVIIAKDLKDFGVPTDEQHDEIAAFMAAEITAFKKEMEKAAPAIEKKNEKTHSPETGMISAAFDVPNSDTTLPSVPMAKGSISRFT